MVLERESLQNVFNSGVETHHQKNRVRCFTYVHLLLSGFGSSGRQSTWSVPGWPRVSEQSKNKFGDWGAGGLKRRNSVFYLSHSFFLLMNHQLVWFRLIHVTDQLQDLEGQCYHVINHLVVFKFIYFIVNFSILLICVVISSDVIGKTMSKKPQDFSQVAKCLFATLTNLGVLLFLNLWAILNQYLLQNKHASISSFQGRIFKKSRQTTFLLDTPRGFFHMFGCC